MNEAIESGSNKIDEEVVDYSQLPHTNGWTGTIILYRGCWFHSKFISNVTSIQQQFQAQDQDIILASNLKSGTTWLKALLFSILNRYRFTPFNTPLLTSNPHHLVPFLEMDIFSENRTHDLSIMSPPRLYATHIPYLSLPESIVYHSKCRIVYIARNPLDYITSYWHFAVKSYPVGGDSHLTIEECVDNFCAGKHEYGPFWDHVLGFWRASQDNPDKVLFLNYEDMVEDAVSHVEKIAEFVGFYFSGEENSQKVIEQIVELCSFESLKELDVNNQGKRVYSRFENKIFFKKGKVGDWVNNLSPSMVERVEEVIHEKLFGSGLTFKYKI